MKTVTIDFYRLRDNPLWNGYMNQGRTMVIATPKCVDCTKEKGWFILQGRNFQLASAFGEVFKAESLKGIVSYLEDTLHVKAVLHESPQWRGIMGDVLK